MAVAPACATNARLSASATAALVRDRICLMGWEPSKLLLTGDGDCEEGEKPSHYFGLNPRHSLTLSRPLNFQPLVVCSKMKRIGAFSQSLGVSLNGQ